MSDTGQGGGQRSWWEEPDADRAPQDPYSSAASPDPERSPDAHDPYRGPASEDATRAHPTAPGAPTQSLPGYGRSAPEPAPNPYGDAPYGNDQHTQQYGRPASGDASPGVGAHGGPSAEQPSPNHPYGGGYGTRYPDQQYANQQYANQYGDQQYANQQYPRQGYDQPPVTGLAHAVLWTSVGGIVLSWTMVGWIASIVALALIPAARREIVAAHGAKRGLGFLLAGKIVAWVNIGLTVLTVIGFLALFGWLGSQGWQYDDGSSWDTNVSVLFTR